MAQLYPDSWGNNQIDTRLGEGLSLFNPLSLSHELEAVGC
jgi:hypothetical protein